MFFLILPDVCQPAVSKPIVWVSFTANILTDIYLILIPLPMLWRSSLKTIKKIASSFILGAGIFILVCATLKSIFVLIVRFSSPTVPDWTTSNISSPALQDDEDGAQLAGAWGIREAFVAVIVTNLPMIFPLIRTLLTPIFGKAIASTQKKGSYKTPPGFQSIGGGTPGSGYSRKFNRRGTTDLSTLTGSEDQIVDNNLKLQDMQTFAGPTSATGDSPSSGILVQNSINVQHEDRPSSQDVERGVEHVREAC